MGMNMTDQTDKGHRRSVRLRGYDYSQAGAYFVTVCVHDRECLFGDIEDGHMRLNDCGKIVESEWLKSAELRLEIECGQFVVMPNHFHGIVHIVGAYGNTPLNGDTPVSNDMRQRAFCHTPLRSPSRNLGAMIRGFKSAVGKRMNEIGNTPGAAVWQRNYFEHVIRDEEDYNRIVEYVENNPQRWMEDSLHP
jgi:REP element-mobilizing transposase RayT